MILPFFIGTYTSPTGSQGIYQSTLNLKTGELTTPILAAKTPNPSYLAISPTQPILYCANETASGGVTSFSIGPENQLTNPTEFKITGGGPCFLSLNPYGSQIFTASYGTGDFNSFNTSGPALWHHNNNSAEQPASRAHCIKLHPTLPFAYATDLGRNQILTWIIRDGIPQALQTHILKSGSPRHFVFSKSGQTLYVNSEHSSTVTALKINSSTGELTELQTLTAIDPKNSTKNTTAEILLHPTGNFLYVSNRGQNSIATYKIKLDESLEGPTLTPTEADTIRGLAIDPTGTYLLAAGQQNNLIISLKINPETGIPTPTTHKITVSKPVHMLFAR
ncbi:MAG: lactonase family protein [Fimbriimonadaceae bacterium]